MSEVLVCASCPAEYRELVSPLCSKLGIKRAFNGETESFDAADSMDHVAKWEARVVAAVLKTAQARGASRAGIICIMGSPLTDLEVARLPTVTRAIKQALHREDFSVRAELLEPQDFLERFGDGLAKAAPRVARSASRNGKVPTPPRDASAKRSAAPAGRTAPRPSSRGLGAGAAPAGPPVRCRACSESFPDRWALLNRHWFCGGREPSWACAECDARLSTEDDCRRHQAATGHLGIDRVNADDDTQPSDQPSTELTVRCRECGERFKDRWAMLQQHWFCSGQEPCWLCVDCGKRFEVVEECVQHQSVMGHCGFDRINRDALF